MLVYLTGFMCSGKTTEGKALAEKLRIPFLDLDSELEKRSGMSVRSFIESNGISDFRQLESEILLQSHQLLQRQMIGSHHFTNKPEAIIATGGGSVLTQENRDFLHQPGHAVVWLNLPFTLLLERIRVNSRPLSHDLNDEAIYQLYLERLPYYQNTCTHSISSLPVTEQILRLILLATKT